jgi:hypothetical protein
MTLAVWRQMVPCPKFGPQAGDAVTRASTLALCFMQTFNVQGIAIMALARGTQPRPEITVRVFNYAEIPPEALARAEREVIRIFSTTGIQAHWLNCPLSPTTAHNAAICPGSWLWTDLLLRVIPLATADRGNNALGFALPSSEGGIVAVIFYDRVEELTKAGVAGAGQILGYAVAHEIGHLLLGSIIHSCTGIMSSPWSREDVKLARLLFTRGQARMMRGEVVRRMQLPPRT